MTELLTAWLVTIPEVREYVAEVVCDDGSGPLESWRPVGIFAAETAGQAKSDALRAWSRSRYTGVYGDDYKALRARDLGVWVEQPRGCLDESTALWSRVHEVLDHDGAECRCEDDDA
jgi:hypothetical protein